MNFDAYAVTTAWGPHVTLQAGVVHLGRHWTTTTRRSVKVRSIGRNGWASASHTSGGRTTITGGPARVLDPARPGSLLGAPTEAVLAGGAMVRIASGQLPQLVGYAEAGSGVPPDFLPWGRAMLVIVARARLVLDTSGTISEATGTWSLPAATVEPGGDATTARAVPFLAAVPAAVPEAVPPAVVALAGVDGPCWLGVTTPWGTVAVPARWSASTSAVTTSAAALTHLGATLPGPVCVTLDDSRSRRPDRKVGCMLRGTASAVATDSGRTAIAVEVQRVTWWDGFVSGSQSIGGTSPDR